MILAAAPSSCSARWPAWLRCAAVVACGSGSPRRCTPAGPGGPAGGQDDPRARGRARHGAAADQDVITRALGSLGHRRRSTGGSREGHPLRVPSPGPRGRAGLAGRGRPALRRHRRAWSSTAASSSPPGCAARSARCGPSRSPASTRGASSCGSAAPTSPRPSAARGRCCAPARSTCSSRCRSAPTRAAAASRPRWSYHNWLIGSIPRPGQDAGRPRAGLRVALDPAVRDVDPRAEGHRRPGPAGAGLPPVRLRHR